MWLGLEVVADVKMYVPRSELARVPEPLACCYTLPEVPVSTASPQRQDDKEWLDDEKEAMVLPMEENLSSPQYDPQQVVDGLILSPDQYKRVVILYNRPDLLKAREHEDLQKFLTRSPPQLFAAIARVSSYQEWGAGQLLNGPGK